MGVIEPQTFTVCLRNRASLIVEPTMFNNWQLWIVIACVLLAGWRVLVRIWRGMTVSEEKGCGGGCHSCPTATAKTDPPLVELDLFHRP
jgi:hypothetical protein